MNLDDVDDSTKFWIGKFVMVFHFCLVVWIFSLALISFETQWLLISIVLNTTVLTMWYIFGTCPLNKLENYLSSNTQTDHNGLPKNNFIYILAPIFGDHGEEIIYHIFSLIPLFGVYVACYKLLNNKYNPQANFDSASLTE
jgi:hypothetical protein